MALIILNYLPYQTDVGFLRIKQQYIDIQHWRMAFFIHVYASIWVLIAGFTQFSNKIQQSYPKLHRYIGYSYVINILFITGPAGFMMGFYANGGTPARVGFIILAVLWIIFTLLAWKYARKRDFIKHRNYMIRSYALTLSAITLRCWKYLIVNLDLINPSWVFLPMDIYIFIAWAGWVINLFAAEWIILRSKVREIRSH